MENDRRELNGAQGIGLGWLSKYVPVRASACIVDG